MPMKTAWNSSRSIIINIERYKLEVLSQNGNGSGVGAMAPAASLFYSWDEDEDDGTPRTITLDCLLPTGVIIPLRVDKDNTLAEIKEVRVCSHQGKAKKSNNKQTRSKIKNKQQVSRKLFPFAFAFAQCEHRLKLCSHWRLVLTLAFTRPSTHLNYDTSIDADADVWCK